MENMKLLLTQGRGSTLTYGLYKYVLQDRVWFFWFSILKEGIIFAHVGVVFQVRSLNCIRSNDSA